MARKLPIGLLTVDGHLLLRQATISGHYLTDPKQVVVLSTGGHNPVCNLGAPRRVPSWDALVSTAAPTAVEQARGGSRWRLLCAMLKFRLLGSHTPGYTMRRLVLCEEDAFWPVPMEVAPTDPKQMARETDEYFREMYMRNGIVKGARQARLMSMMLPIVLGLVAIAVIMTVAMAFTVIPQLRGGG
ncbi:MAG TPA: hypothetical protein VJA25_01410 [Dehalococcoidia bacterium]|nr:hypothetical protein [Dehalococcoidia bacterium]